MARNIIIISGKRFSNDRKSTRSPLFAGPNPKTTFIVFASSVLFLVKTRREKQQLSCEARKQQRIRSSFLQVNIDSNHWGRTVGGIDSPRWSPGITECCIMISTSSIIPSFCFHRHRTNIVKLNNFPFSGLWVWLIRLTFNSSSQPAGSWSLSVLVGYFCNSSGGSIVKVQVIYLKVKLTKSSSQYCLCLEVLTFINSSCKKKKINYHWIWKWPGRS